MSETQKIQELPEFPDPLSITESAVNKIAELMLEEDNKDLRLRVYIEGGGCSGFQYGFNFEEETQSDDTVITRIASENFQSTVVNVIVDPSSLQYLMGAEIDYKKDLEGERFIIRNPNAKTTCGCGSSFEA